MNKLRPIRFKNMTVDMTAMCDVTFLLLFFFVTMTKFDQWEPIKVDTPLSKTFNYLPIVNNLGIVYVSGNKVMYQIVNDSVRKHTLTQMSHIYNASFSKTEQEKFVNSPITGSSVCDLKQYDDQYMDWVNVIDRPGIPYESVALEDNELFNWIKQSRITSKVLFSRDLRIVIKADKDVHYPVVKRVIAILQKQKVNKFSLWAEEAKNGY